MAKNNFSANVKEWSRKQTVNLKKKPNLIPLVILVLTTLIYMLRLTSLSAAVYDNIEMGKGIGLCIFINTLISLLVCVAMLNAFPRLKKQPTVKKGKKSKGEVKVNPALAKIKNVLAKIWNAYKINYQSFMWTVLVYAMIAIMIIAECAYISICLSAEGQTALINSVSYAYVHIVLLAISAVTLALLPLYAKLIRKIDTSKEIEGGASNIQIDIHED